MSNNSNHKETRWIETESLQNGSITAAAENDYDEDGEQPYAALDSLFADPDPFETFTYHWTLKSQHDKGSNDEDSDPSNNHEADDDDTCNKHREIRLSVTGHKAENGQTLHSTGLTVWRAAGILADWLVEQHRDHNTDDTDDDDNTGNDAVLAVLGHGCSNKKTVLELGAGLGIPGMVCHKLGRAAVVILTDGDTDALANLRENVARNCCTTATSTSTDNPTVPANATAATSMTNANIITCQQLVWGNKDHIQAVRESLSLLRASDSNRRSANTAATADRGFDVILGSDIIYVNHVVDPLFDTVRQLLRCGDDGDDDDDGGGVFLLAFARRNVSMDWVLDIAKRQGFVWETPETPEGVYIFRYNTKNEKTESSTSTV